MNIDFTKNIYSSFLEYIKIKFLFERKFCSVYEISFYSSLIITALLGIFSIFDFYFFHLDNFKDYFDNFNVKELLILLGNLITQLGLYISNLFTLFTNKNNTPCHIFIIRIFGQLAYYIDFSVKSIPVFVCLIFILFVSLIFNEIIEFNFCGLSDNTRKNIMLISNENSDMQKNVTIDSKGDILIELYDDKDSENDINSVSTIYN